jgi:hypothetical protein
MNTKKMTSIISSVTGAVRLTRTNSIGAAGNILDAELVVIDVGKAPLLVGAAVVGAVEHLYVSYSLSCKWNWRDGWVWDLLFDKTAGRV